MNLHHNRKKMTPAWRMFDDSPILRSEQNIESMKEEEVEIVKSLSEIKTRNGEDLVHKSVEIHKIGDKINQKYDIFNLSEWLANFTSVNKIKEKDDIDDLQNHAKILFDWQRVILFCIIL